VNEPQFKQISANEILSLPRFMNSPFHLSDSKTTNLSCQQLSHFSSAQESLLGRLTAQLAQGVAFSLSGWPLGSWKAGMGGGEERVGPCGLSSDPRLTFGPALLNAALYSFMALGTPASSLLSHDPF
jgi:hypothetical protein